METSSITGLDDLDQHIQEILQAPDAPLNAKLFDEVELQLTGTSDIFLIWLFVMLVSASAGLPQAFAAVSLREAGNSSVVLGYC